MRLLRVNSCNETAAGFLAFTPVGFSFHTKFTFVNEYTMQGLDDYTTRFMYGRAAAQCTSCDAANIPLRRRVLFGPDG